jgi:hypothetical protein
VVRPPYTAVVRLYSVADARYAEIEAAYYQIDLMRVRPRKFINLVYAWCVARVAHDDYEKWHTELHDLLPWQDSNTAAAANMEAESFLAMQAKGG